MPAADTLTEERDALCAELIALESEGQPRVTRAAAIEARLNQIAGERGCTAAGGFAKPAQNSPILLAQ